MAEDHIRYDVLAQEALRGVVRKVLVEVSRTGLPGEHHFFINFVTRAPGVRMSQRLLDKYEKEMTIVLQNQFWDLKVGDTGFEVGLSFDGVQEHLSVPFTAIKGFFDPSVQFGLQFDVESAAVVPTETPVPEAEPVPAAKGTAPKAAKPEPADADKVVSLDSFRKKP